MSLALRLFVEDPEREIEADADAVEAVRPVEVRENGQPQDAVLEPHFAWQSP
jgi:hypothetical protein